jgi:hypothetical protein
MNIINRLPDELQDEIYLYFYADHKKYFLENIKLELEDYIINSVLDECLIFNFCIQEVFMDDILYRNNTNRNLDLMINLNEIEFTIFNNFDILNEDNEYEPIYEIKPNEILRYKDVVNMLNNYFISIIQYLNSNITENIEGLERYFLEDLQIILDLENDKIILDFNLSS